MATLETLKRRLSRFDLDWVQVIVIVNLAAFAISLAVSAWLNDTIPNRDMHGGQSSGFGGFAPNSEALWYCGSGAAWRISQGEVWRLFTATILHGGIVHLLVNGMSFLNLAPFVVSLVGGRRFLTVYLASALGGSIASAGWIYFRAGPDNFTSMTQSIGASGAVCGLLGFLVGNFWTAKDGAAGAFKRQLLFWAGIILVYGLLSPHIDNAGHIGGALTGFFFGFTHARPSFKGGAKLLKSGILRSLLVVAFLLSIAAALVHGFGPQGDRLRQGFLMRGPVAANLWLVNPRIAAETNARTRIDQLDSAVDVLESPGFEDSDLIKRTREFYRLKMEEQRETEVDRNRLALAEQRYEQDVQEMIRRLGALSLLEIQRRYR